METRQEVLSPQEFREIQGEGSGLKIISRFEIPDNQNFNNGLAFLYPHFFRTLIRGAADLGLRVIAFCQQNRSGSNYLQKFHLDIIRTEKCLLEPGRLEVKFFDLLMDVDIVCVRRRGAASRWMPKLPEKDLDQIQFARQQGLIGCEEYMLLSGVAYELYELILDRHLPDEECWDYVLGQGVTIM